MKLNLGTFACVVLLGTGVVVSDVLAQVSRVSYGRITAVRQVELQNDGAQAAGAMVGGLAGLATGSGQSSSNRALRTLGGAAVGSRVGGAAGRTTAFEYTVLVGGTNTIRIVTEKAGLRVRDCVSVETGQFNNIRLAPDERCDAAAAASAARAAPPAAQSAADACAQATQQLLDAQTDEEFDRAERRMRLLCD
jgi:outer membrane lipoprotein SlyB